MRRIRRADHLARLSLELDNSGAGPLVVPGFAHVPIEAELDTRERFTHGLNGMLWLFLRPTAREISMLRAMEEVTDRPNWHGDVFRDNIVAEWKAGAVAKDYLVSDRAWEWCVEELRDKAKEFGVHGRVLVLDCLTGVCKVDISNDICDDLKGAFEVVAEEMEAAPASHRSMSGFYQMMEIVDPSLYPLVYGRTKVLEQGGAVSVKDMDDWYGRGIESENQELLVDLYYGLESEQTVPRHRRHGGGWRRWDGQAGDQGRPPNHGHRCSSWFQWLPCEVVFTGDSSPGVQITSYINNLHPQRYSKAYKAIEKAVSAAVEAWNDVLDKSEPFNWHKTQLRPLPGRTPQRIKTYGVQYPVPLTAYSDELSRAHHFRDSVGPESPEAAQAIKTLEEALARCRFGTREELLEPNSECSYPQELDGWDILKRYIHPEPGVSFSYSDWATGHNTSRGIVPIKTVKTDNFVEYSYADHEYFDVSLRDEFADRGLQVIVRVASIELTPDRPSHPGEPEDHLDGQPDELSFHPDGQLNEHVVATALVFFDVENVTPLRVLFCRAARLRACELADHKHEDLGALMEVFGPLEYYNDEEDAAPCLARELSRMRDMGSVGAWCSSVRRKGRLVAFPSALHYRLGECELVDRDRPGRARFLALHLVDPNYRVCSTRNVPPQRPDWWAYDVAKKAPVSAKGLPQELIDQILEDAKVGMMGAEEAEEIRRDVCRELICCYQQVEDYTGRYQKCRDCLL
jgi:hypothetical protein